MADQIQFRGGPSSEGASFTGAAREITVDTTLNTLRIHDGSTAGGTLLAKASDLQSTQSDQADILSALGVSSSTAHLGTFSGSHFGDNLSVKTVLQAIETALENKATLIGASLNSTNLGVFSGSTIADNQTVKAAIQALETTLEAVDIDTDDLAALTGIAENVTNLGTFTGSTISDNQAVKSALQELETATELRATIATPAFTGHAYAPEWRATGTGHLKLRAETGNDLNIYLADQETLQITRDPSTGNPKFTAKGGTGEFKFNQIADLNGGFKVGGTEITASATELNYVDGVTSNVQTQIDDLSGATTLSIAAVQADVDQNEADADAAIALKANIDDPTFTTKIEAPEFHSVGTGHLKFRGGGNDIIFYPQDTETLQITRSGTDCRFTSNGGTGTFKFNQITEFADGITLDSVSVTTLQSSGEAFADNDTSLMTSAAIDDRINTAVAATIDGAPGALDTLNELAAALGDDANFSTTVTNLINANETHIDNVATLSGVAKDSTNLGTFSGATITDSSTIKTALQELETKVEAVQADVDQNESDADAAIAANEVHIDNKATLLGVAKDSTHLGTFTGSTIADNQTIKAAIQALETADELKATIASPAFTGELATLIGSTTLPVVHRIQGGFPDINLRTNGTDVATNQNEGRLLWEDAGGGAVAAIKQTMLTTAPMRFFTGGITASDEQMRINANGRVGIGTTDPDALLHVQGSVIAEADFPDVALRSGGERRVLFADVGGSAQGGIKFSSNTFKIFAGGGIASGNEAIACNGTTIETKDDLVQNPGSSVTPAENGEMVVEATNNTTLTFKLKGSDGTVRSGTITLS